MNDQTEFDFEHSLPAGKEYFTLRYLARLWDCSEDTIQRLIDTGDLFLAADIAPKTSVKSMQRITRISIVTFLNSRRSDVFKRKTKKVEAAK